ncbi:hypothetical protein PL8927_830297 [Planktothrix serta PCC 8927]|uniref:Uncharacterized protein n=1 Tax=Planktothrix serta PCC 8927 TaxID=671068 RepID=A0A7Z9BYE0_9CYAN|nr:hypothetical protein PL8927_830297 [Planktothrix serta PCC 8927]
MFLYSQSQVKFESILTQVKIPLVVSPSGLSPVIIFPAPKQCAIA